VKEIEDCDKYNVDLDTIFLKFVEIMIELHEVMHKSEDSPLNFDVEFHQLTSRKTTTCLEKTLLFNKTNLSCEDKSLVTIDKKPLN